VRLSLTPISVMWLAIDSLISPC